MNDLKSTALHTLEIAAIIGLVFGITKLFPGLIPNELIKDAVLVCIAGLVKFVRSSDSMPIKDYVNS